MPFPYTFHLTNWRHTPNKVSPKNKLAATNFVITPSPNKRLRPEQQALIEIQQANKADISTAAGEATPKATGIPPDGAIYGHLSNTRTSGSLDSRRHGSTWTNVKAETDIPYRHELYLLADGEKKVEVEPVTQIANAAIFKFNKEDHTLANMLRDKLYRSEHVTFVAYKVPHPLFATFNLRVHTDGDISPKEAVVKASQELVQELQVLDQEFTKEFELRKITGQGPIGLD